MSLQNEELDSIRTWHVLYILFHNSHKILSCSNKIITWEDRCDWCKDRYRLLCVQDSTQSPASWCSMSNREMVRIHVAEPQSRIKHEQSMNTSGKSPPEISCFKTPSASWRGQWGGTGQKLSWTTKHLHGMYHRPIEEMAGIKKSYQWLEKTTLQDCTEALIMAVQEEALSIRSIELGLYHSQQDQSYRLPQSVPETIWHIATWGKVQAWNEHNQVSEIVYRNIRGLPLQKRSVRSTKTAVTADGLQKISWRDILRFLSESQNKRLLLSSALSEAC